MQAIANSRFRSSLGNVRRVLTVQFRILCGMLRRSVRHAMADLATWLLATMAAIEPAGAADR
jgi:hypothetical protein